ncbi:MAG: hypothetical protein CMA77_00745 [Euryarchaeota archaeon]|nr:hypothetical protein [Euryarchaeota archaeon]
MIENHTDSEDDKKNSDDGPLLPRWFCWTWPGTTWGWVFWSIGALSLGFGLFSSLTTLITVQNKSGLVPLSFAVPGLIILGFASPNPFKQMMDQFVPGGISDGWNVDPTPPMKQSEWHLDRLEWDEKEGEWESNPLSRYEQDGPELTVEADGDEWVVNLDGNIEGKFSSEDEASNHMKKIIKKAESIDAQELIFTEHPRHKKFSAMYNATPTQFTARFFCHIFAVLFLTGCFLGLPKSTRIDLNLLFISLISIGTILIIYSYFSNKKVMEAWDTITSIVKFIDGGHNELVGQVRPITDASFEVLNVDGCKDEGWTFRNLVAWSWAYNATERWTETYTDSKGRLRTRTRTETRLVRGGSQKLDYMLHDGTGGILIKTPTFEDVDLGNSIWERNKRGKKGCGPYETPKRGGRMIRHEWTLDAIAMGDPTYVMARVKGRPHDEIPRGTVSENASRVHHTLMAVGEDAPRRHAKIAKGTEFSILKPKTSLFGNFGPSALLIITTIIVLMISL